jgi:hypothetical protein
MNECYNIRGVPKDLMTTLMLEAKKVVTFMFTGKPGDRVNG